MGERRTGLPFEHLWREVGWFNRGRGRPRLKAVVLPGLDWYPRPGIWDDAVEVLRWRPSRRAPRVASRRMWARTLWRDTTLAAVLFPLGVPAAVRQALRLAYTARSQQIPLVLVARWPSSYEANNHPYQHVRRGFELARTLTPSLILVGPEWFGESKDIFGSRDVATAWGTILGWLAHGFYPRFAGRRAWRLGIAAATMGWGTGRLGLAQAWREAWSRAARMGMDTARGLFVHAVIGPESHPRDVRNTLEAWLYEHDWTRPLFWSAQVDPSFAGRVRVLLVAVGLPNRETADSGAPGTWCECLASTAS
ncbi:MAG: hypothetical protein GXO54_07355 [Chloroflexi bacterium]|nr:hypothetical protein [Chloroflexota bacterium]